MAHEGDVSTAMGLSLFDLRMDDENAPEPRRLQIDIVERQGFELHRAGKPEEKSMKHDVTINVFGSIDDAEALSDIVRAAASEGALTWRSVSTVAEILDDVAYSQEYRDSMTLFANDLGDTDDMFPELRALAQRHGLSYVVAYGSPVNHIVDRGFRWTPSHSDEQHFIVGADSRPIVPTSMLKEAIVEGPDAVRRLVEEYDALENDDALVVPEDVIEACREILSPAMAR